MVMCPRCREPLVVFEVEGIEVDRCLECGGTWLDSGELEWIAERAGVDPGPLSASVRAGGRRTELRCPRCRTRMEVVSIGQGEPVELDRCRREHGLWFDAGEMEKVVVAFADGEEGAVARFFANLYGHEPRSENKGV